MKSPERPKPYIDYYNRGLLSKRELFALTVPLRGFLTRNAVSLSFSKFNTAVEDLGRDGSIFAVKKEKGGAAITYRVDPELASSHVGGLKAFLEELKYTQYPLRTPEEKEKFQVQLLRIKNEDGTYTPISQDEAIVHLLDIGKKRIAALGWHAEAEDITVEAVVKMLPYLQGERGDFPDFFSFKKFYSIGLSNLLVDAYRRKVSERTTVERYTQELGEHIVFSSEDIRDNPDRTFELSWQHVLARLPIQEDIQLFLRRNLYRNTWEVIAREYGDTPNAVRGRYRRILESMRSGKGRGPQGRPKVSEQVDAQRLAAYDAFSRDFMVSNGRKPTRKDMVNARRDGTFPYTVSSLLLRFGNGNWIWEEARTNMERLLEQEKQTVPSR